MTKCLKVTKKVWGKLLTRFIATLTWKRVVVVEAEKNIRGAKATIKALPYGMMAGLPSDLKDSYYAPVRRLELLINTIEQAVSDNNYGLVRQFDKELQECLTELRELYYGRVIDEPYLLKEKTTQS